MANQTNKFTGKLLSKIIPDFNPDDERHFQGYRHTPPKGGETPALAQENLLGLESGSDIIKNPIWRQLLIRKLGLMLGFPTHVPAITSTTAFFLYHLGEHFTGPAILVKCTPGMCHLNSICLWDRNRHQLDLVTGYCMRQGEWFSHSWCVPKGERQVIETSQRMDFYFGLRFPKSWSQEWLKQSRIKIRELRISDNSRIRTIKTRVGTTLKLSQPPKFIEPTTDETSET